MDKKRLSWFKVAIVIILAIIISFVLALIDINFLSGIVPDALPPIAFGAVITVVITYFWYIRNNTYWFYVPWTKTYKHSNR